MGNCFCYPSKTNFAPEKDQIKLTSPNAQIILVPTNNHSKNQTPKSDCENNDNNANKSTKNGGEAKNFQDEEDDIKNVSQIFITEENQDFNEDIKNQSKINLEDFKLLRVY